MKMVVMVTVTVIRLICSLCCQKDRLLSTKICASARTWMVSRKPDTIFGRGTIPEPSTSHIGQGVALGAPATVLVYI